MSMPFVRATNNLGCPYCRASHTIPSTGAAGFVTNYDLQRIITADTLPGVPNISETTNVTARAHRQAISSNNNGVRQQSISTVSSTVDRPNNVFNNMQQHQQEADRLLAVQMSTINYVNNSRQEQNIDRRQQEERVRRQQQEDNRRQQEERVRRQQQEDNRRQQEERVRRQQQADNRRQQEERVRRQQQEDNRRQQEERVRRQQQEDNRRQQEERVRRQQQEDNRRQQEERVRRQQQEDNRRQQEERVRRQQQEDNRRQQEDRERRQREERERSQQQVRENHLNVGICGFITRIRQQKERVVRALLIDRFVWYRMIIVISNLVTFSRLVAGAAKLSSNCDLEHEAAVYLFVKACLAVFFWGALTVWICKENTENILKNRFIEAYIFLDLLFSLCWLCVGTVFIFGNFSNFNNVCKGSEEHFINFALTLTIVDYFGLAVFILFCGYVLCEPND